MRVLVAGAGLAGLAAARALAARGAEVVIVEARDRVGGRVWTIRDEFSGQHAEGGGDLIDSDQEALLTIARELGLATTKILRGGFGFYGATRDGKIAIQSMGQTFGTIAQPLGGLLAEYRLTEERWQGPIAANLGRSSVADWLRRIGAEPWLVERFRGFRGLFLADPEELSLLAVVDFFAADPWAGRGHTLRLKAGNDRLASGMAAELAAPPELRTILRRVEQDASGIWATVERDGVQKEIRADYLVAALPTPNLREVLFEPRPPEAQWRAITALRSGAATRVLLQCARPFWRRPGRPGAFGSDQPTGAVWDGNEQQRGAGILSLLAGGRASAEVQAILRAEGAQGVLDRLGWLGRPSKLLAARAITWEEDPWARGGYAYFDPAFRPDWRDLLALPFGRVVFAGEHTHVRWQGYMNGAIESGQRAAAEIFAFRPDESPSDPIPRRRQAPRSGRSRPRR